MEIKLISKPRMIWLKKPSAILKSKRKKENGFFSFYPRMPNRLLFIVSFELELIIYK